MTVALASACSIGGGPTVGYRWTTTAQRDSFSTTRVTRGRPTLAIGFRTFGGAGHELYAAPSVDLVSTIMCGGGI